MLSQILDVLKEEYEKHGDKLILDSYTPAEGTYVIVVPQGDGFKIDEKINIKIDKESKEIDRTLSKYMDFICLADYYSKITDTNKVIVLPSGKMITSNNYLSFIIKKDTLTDEKFTIELINKFYDILANPRLKYKKNTLDLYNLAEKKIGEVDKNRIEKIRKWIINNLFTEFKGYTGQDYLKIFFYYPEEDYKKESERYFIPTIYNSNEYNQLINKTVYGLPNDNMGLNSKKPYLENKTRKIKTPYLLNQEEVMYQRKLFDYFMNQVLVDKVNIYI